MTVHKVNLYAIKDNATGLFGQMSEMNSDLEFIRNVKTFINNDTSSVLSSSPDDFSLWRLGSLEKETGMFTSDQEMICPVTALVYVDLRSQDVA